MTKYAPDFKYRAALHYHQVHSRQRTADHLNFSRTHLRRWLAAYRQGGIASVLSWNKKSRAHYGFIGVESQSPQQKNLSPAGHRGSCGKHSQS